MALEGLYSKKYFDELGLDIPYIPENQMDKISMVQPGLFSSRESPGPVYDIEAFVHEAISKNVEEYVIFGMAGHGISSHAMHYYFVSEHLALFIQADFGNAYRDEEVCSTRLRGMLNLAYMLVQRIEEATKKSLIAKGKRILVVESDFRGRGWCWIDGLPGEIDPERWHSDEGVLHALMSGGKS